MLAIVGLGYVGLPLAHALASKGYRTVGFDSSADRIADLRDGRDRTEELTPEQLKGSTIEFTDDPAVLKQADILILALPTPVDHKNVPDLTLLAAASQTVGRNLKKGAIVVYESTVYPGVTEEFCGPILERESGLTCGKDFTLGYSPERINPGDKQHTVTKITKIVAGQDAATLDTLADLYGSMIEAGIHRAPSIKVAEMAKAIENAQRDLNIAFMNEIALLCHRLEIRTRDVLDAARTKWNFLPFTPGLVGGHCIGVDPYYLVEKARLLGMPTHVITAGRALNDSMAQKVADQVAESLGSQDARVLVLGLTFKENVPDTRNSKSRDVVNTLLKHGYTVEVHDPFADAAELRRQNLAGGSLQVDTYDAVVLLVPHKAYLDALPDVVGAVKAGGLVYDLKSVLDPAAITASGRTYLAL